MTFAGTLLGCKRASRTLIANPSPGAIGPVREGARRTSDALRNIVRAVILRRHAEGALRALGRHRIVLVKAHFAGVAFVAGSRWEDIGALWAAEAAGLARRAVRERGFPFRTAGADWRIARCRIGAVIAEAAATQLEGAARRAGGYAAILRRVWETALRAWLADERTAL